MMNNKTDIFTLNVPRRKVATMQIAVVINNNGFFPCAPSLLAPTQGPVSATITIAPEVARPKA